jgi:transcriptional regulator with XRE-family HTH domain
MLALITETDLLLRTALAVRERRQSLGLRQIDLAQRSGVAIATLRRFENTGQITFGGLAKLLVACGMADAFLAGLKPPVMAAPASIGEFLAAAPKPRQRVRLRKTD